MKILLFGGTTEGRVLAQKLLALGHAVTVSVATALGAEMLGDFPKDHILTGRLAQPDIARRLPDYALCIDATHPYAVEVTKNIQAACEALGIPHKNILALQGPFTREMNKAMLTQYNVKWLVTKDGGKAGGFTDKADAAREKHVPLVLIRRPQEDGQTMEEILHELGEEEGKCK